MNEFDRVMTGRLARLEAANLRRNLRRVDSAPGRTVESGGRALINFSSNDYLGLANDSRLKASASRATETFGAGSGASRLISGTLKPHAELEARLAGFKRTEAALVFSSGMAAAMGTLGALLRPCDYVLIDRLAHASLVDGARFSGATMRVFAHNDLEQLEARLAWAAAAARSGSKDGNDPPHVLVVTESLFSMDGDFAPLREIAELTERHGAWLMVDEAHATGVVGDEGRGCVDAAGLGAAVQVQMGTLGKALGSAGGFIAGSAALIQCLVNQARAFIFSTAPPASVCAAALAGVEIAASEDGAARRQTLFEHIERLASAMRGGAPRVRSPIVPILVGAEEKAMTVSQRLFAKGIWVPAIRYPAVARGRARLRVSLSAAHLSKDLDKLIEALGQEGLV